MRTSSRWTAVAATGAGPVMESLNGTDCVALRSARSHPPPAATGARPRRLDRRGRTVLAVAAAAALLVNSGVAWVYWRIGEGGGVAGAESTVELKLRARSDESMPLRPGGAANLTVTVTNQHAFPVRIVALRQGAGQVTVDSRHRDAGCRATGVAVVADPMPVSWEVPRNAIGVFTVPDAVRMSTGSDPSCQGAVFTVPVRATGVSGSL